MSLPRRPAGTEPTYARRAAVLGAVLVLAAGCGGDDAEPPTPADTTATTDTPSTAPPTLAGGQDASSDLSEFVCAPDASGVWNATGVLTSTASAPADYSVTVIVAGPEASAAPGRRRVLEDLDPGVPVRFQIRAVPPEGDRDLTCQVRVLRLSD